MNIINLSIGGINFAIQSDQKAFIDSIQEKYKGFLAKNKVSDFNVQLEVQIYLPSDEIAVMQQDGIYSIDGGEFQGEVDFDKKVVTGRLRSEISVLDSFLRVVCSIIFPYFEGFLVHSAGLANEGLGYIFPGRSSSGKTTTARRAGEFQVLNDELTLVRKWKNRFCVFATPFTGDYEGNIVDHKGTLDKVLFLDKTLTVPIVREDKADMIVHLMENIFFFDSYPETNKILLGLCAQIVKEIEAYKVNILLKRSIGELVDELSSKKYCS